VRLTPLTAVSVSNCLTKPLAMSTGCILSGIAVVVFPSGH
jgi:hypothetical protein